VEEFLDAYYGVGVCLCVKCIRVYLCMGFIDFIFVVIVFCAEKMV
jgi:hypothetical protein